MFVNNFKNIIIKFGLVFVIEYVKKKRKNNIKIFLVG